MGILKSFYSRDSLLLWGHATSSSLGLQPTLDPKSCALYPGALSMPERKALQSFVVIQSVNLKAKHKLQTHLPSLTSRQRITSLITSLPCSAIWGTAQVNSVQHHFNTSYMENNLNSNTPLLSPFLYKSKEEEKPALKAENHWEGNNLRDQLIPCPAKGELPPPSVAPEAPHLQLAEPPHQAEPPGNP